jgi:hypothetical protein
VVTSDRSTAYKVYKAGTYTIEEIHAGACEGLVKGSAISVKEVPPPTSYIDIQPERDW